MADLVDMFGKTSWIKERKCLLFLLAGKFITQVERVCTKSISIALRRLLSFGDDVIMHSVTNYINRMNIVRHQG